MEFVRIWHRRVLPVYIVISRKSVFSSIIVDVVVVIIIVA